MTHNYKKLIKDIRKESFPEIRGKIIIIKAKFLPSWAAFIWLIPLVRIIIINPIKTKECTTNEIEALIVHELCHAIQGKRMGYILFWIIFLSNKRWQKNNFI